jgi:hypothetical protein
MSSAPATGALVADVLSGAWRGRDAPAWTLTGDQLESAAALLHYSGTAALAWWRLRHTAAAQSPAIASLHQAYRSQSLQAAVYEHRIGEAFRRLQAAGIPAILLKGLASARYYSDVGLRPYGDIDVLMHRSHFDAARQILESPPLAGQYYDLHENLKDLPERSLTELFDRSRIQSIGGTEVRTLGHEDHLAFICVHLLRHGAWRAIWLCDVAAALENQPAGFDWAICLGRHRRRASWILCAIELARVLLDARLNLPPSVSNVPALPSWLERSTLEEWADDGKDRQPARRFLLLRWQDLIARWPNPIYATMHTRGAPNSLPRLPYQVASFFLRAVRYIDPRSWTLHH